ncbi:MAG: class I SAM-dependent methyltransferase [Candidatus Omnitrophica bacterium]|nr:class I SAM-dependent methyltransferase [Candidatus Omnitrophota bacterium]
MQTSRKVEAEMYLSEQEAVSEYLGIAGIIGITYSLLADQIYELSGSLKGKVLDLGTGLGNLAVELARRFTEAEIFGLDISQEMLTQAENSQQKQGINNLKFKLMDVHALDFEENSIDLIASHGSLHHWQDPKKVFLQAQRVLKPGGIIYIADLRRDAPENIVEEAAVGLNPAQKTGFLNSIAASYLPSELEKILIEAGIKDFKITEQKFSRKVIIKNMQRLRNISQRSEEFNRLYLHIIIRK